VISTLEDAEDYSHFEAAVIADYDAQSAVECEVVLRLASVLWRRAITMMEIGLFEIEAEHVRDYRVNRRLLPGSLDVIETSFAGIIPKRTRIPLWSSSLAPTERLALPA
jgi:hypothetical protein